MSVPFYIVYRTLEIISDKTGLTYEEVNVILYYIIIPSVYLALIDKIIRKPIFTISFLTCIFIVLFLSRDCSSLADAIFDASVRFLLSFSNVGMGYDFASVFICIIVPILVFIILLYLAFPCAFRRHMPTISKLLDKGISLFKFKSGPGH